MIQKELIERTLNGDEQALDELLSIFRKSLVRFCKNGGQVDEDALQEAIIEIWLEIKKTSTNNHV